MRPLLLVSPAFAPLQATSANFVALHEAEALRRPTAAEVQESFVWAGMVSSTGKRGMLLDNDRYTTLRGCAREVRLAVDLPSLVHTALNFATESGEDDEKLEGFADALGTGSCFVCWFEDKKCNDLYTEKFKNNGKQKFYAFMRDDQGLLHAQLVLRQLALLRGEEARWSEKKAEEVKHKVKKSEDEKQFLEQQQSFFRNEMLNSVPARARSAVLRVLRGGELADSRLQLFENYESWVAGSDVSAAKDTWLKRANALISLKMPLFPIDGAPNDAQAFKPAHVKDGGNAAVELEEFLSKVDKKVQQARDASVRENELTGTALATARHYAAELARAAGIDWDAIRLPRKEKDINVDEEQFKASVHSLLMRRRNKKRSKREEGEEELDTKDIEARLSEEAKSLIKKTKNTTSLAEPKLYALFDAEVDNFYSYLDPDPAETGLANGSLKHVAEDLSVIADHWKVAEDNAKAVIADGFRELNSDFLASEGEGEPGAGGGEKGDVGMAV